MKVSSIVASILTAACSFCALTSNAAGVNVSTFANFTSGVPENVGNSLTMDEGFDVGNKHLILTGITGLTGSYAFTGDKGGIVDLEFANNFSMKAADSFFTGDIKLIVRGDYTIRLPKTSSHTGGTVVCAGVVDGVTSTTRTLNSMKPFGAAGSVLEIQGGTVLSHAYNTWTGNYSILLNGGCLKNDAAYSGSNVFDASIEVKADSTIEAGNAIPFKPGSISGKGKLTLTGEGGFTIKKDISMPETSLAVATSLALGSYDLEVNDYEVMAETAPTGTGMIKVNGIFKPTTANFSSAVLLNGSTIDLTGWEGKAVVNADGTQVAFVEAATITLDVGDRVVNAGDTVLVWADGTEAAAYEGRIFKIVGQNVASGLAVEATAEGIKAVQASQDIVTAVWKGEGDVNNWEDSANWVCYNAADAVIENGVPGEDLTVVFTDDVSGVPFTNDFPFASARLTDATLSANVDWSAFDLGLITQDSVLDIGENTIKIARESGITSCAATFTSTSEGGVFEIEVAEGASFTNATINLEGAISLKKTGLGALVLTKEGQAYTGKTMIEAGTLVCGTVNVTTAKTFGEGKEIDLANGAILDPAGAIYWNDVVINMNGGKIVNTVKATGIATSGGNMQDYKPAGQSNNTLIPFNPTLVLLDDATIETTEDFNFQGTVNESEYTLNLEVPQGHYFAWYPTSVPNLKLNVLGGGAIATYSKRSVPLSAQEGIKLTLSDAAINLPAAGSNGNGTMDVTDYTAACTISPTIVGAALNVYGTFTPAAVDEEGKEYFYGATMQSGSSIDLSQKTGAWGIKSASFGNNTIKFAEGTGDSPTLVTIKLGARTLQLGEKVIEWTTKPNNIAFTFVREGGEQSPDAIVLADGLYYGEAKIEAAEWTGEAENGVLTDSGNWKGGVLPNGELTAKFTGDISAIVKPEEGKFTCKDLYFSEVTLSKETDLSWVDLNKITDASIIDIKGQKLTIASTNSISTTSATITDSVGGGVVEFTIGEGVVHTNASLALEGGLKLVKKGEGVFVAAKYPQLYTNVTEVVEGGIRCAEGQWMNKEDGKSPFGAACTIALGAGTFLDPAGSYAWANHTIEMNGGIISNTVAQSGMSNTDYNAGKDAFTKPFNPTLDLSVDSLLVSPVNFNFKGTVKGNGHTLTVDVNESYYGTRWVSHDSTEATVVFKTNTVVRILKNSAFSLNELDMTLVMDGAKFDVGGNWSVSNYIAKSESAISTYRGTTDGGWDLKVYGIFRPETSDFLGCVMQNGSTLDLSAQTATFNLYNPQGQKNLDAGVTPWLCQHVTFADNATVTIDVNGRSFGGKNKQIISWTTKPENVSFIIDATSKAAGYELEKKDDGIWVKYSGVLLILK